jgi:general L-amino acid transport system permease protein
MMADHRASKTRMMGKRRRTGDTVAQVICLALFLGLVYGAVTNAMINLERQGIASGFAFWNRTAGFDIIQHLIPYDERATYGDAFWVALLNTLLVAFVGIIGGSLCGVLVGVAAFAQNLLVRTMGRLYIEVIRNIPLLLQLFFWYFGVLRSLPGPRDSIGFGAGIYLNIRGLYLPTYSSSGGWSIPHLDGFNFAGGVVVLPELVALVVTLSIYSGAFIGEIIRGGILAVSRGQWEAAAALGLTRWQTLRLVVMPQARGTILPPLTSQYLNTTKNTSLAAAIAYPDLVLVFAGTVLMQTGQAVEVMTITMLVYLILCLLISVVMNWIQKRSFAHDMG